VAEVFLNGGRHKVDAKGRVSIPSGFRSVIAQGDPSDDTAHQPQFVIFFGDPRRNYLECYTIEAWDEIVARINAMPRSSEKRRTAQFMYFHGSQKMSVDDTGRIVLPQKLREKIGLSGEAEFVAAGDTFQIWEPGVFAEYEASRLSVIEALPDDVDAAALLDEDFDL
jgi:MraZ protein